MATNVEKEKIEISLTELCMINQKSLTKVGGGVGGFVGD